MCQFKETEEGVHPSETPLCGQHDNQTKAQSQEQETDVVDWFMTRFSQPHQEQETDVVDWFDSMDWFMTRFSQPHQEQETDVVDWFMTRFFQPHQSDFSESPSSDSKKDVATADDDSVLSSDSGIYLERNVSSKYKRVSSKRMKPYDRIDSKKNPDHKCVFRPASLPVWLDSSEYLFSHLLKDVATADRYSVWSLDSWLGSGESSSSDLKKDLFRSTDRRCVSRKEKARSYHCDIDFKKNKPVMRIEVPFRPAASLPDRLDFSDSPSSDSKKVATADRDSFWSSDSGLGSLESLSSDLKKDSFQSSDRRPEQQQKPDSQVLSKPMERYESRYAKRSSAPAWLDFSESLFSHPLKDVATADRYSVLSSDSGISLERKVSSKYRHVSSKNKPVMRIEVPFRPAASLPEVSVDRGSFDTMKSDRSRSIGPVFKGEEEKDELPITQELVVGSSAGMETKSTPVAVPTSLLTTIQPADASTHPLPATRDKAKSKWRTKMFRRVRTMFRRNEKSP